MMLECLAVTSTPRAARVMAKLLAVTFVLGCLALWLLPWQQNVRGEGRVIAYAPIDRQQLVESPLDGRVMQWKVQEGDAVVQGDLLAVVADNDPEILERMRRQAEAARARLSAIGTTVEVLREKIKALEGAKTSGMESAEAKVASAEEKVSAAQEVLTGARATLETAQLQAGRLRNLEADGLASRRDLEVAEMQRETGSADVRRATANLASAKADLATAVAERKRIAADLSADVEAARAELQQAMVDKGTNEEALAKLEIQLARQMSMAVRAPKDGRVLRITGGIGGEFVKAGDPLMVLVPETSSRAVELWLDGNDAPLVTPGRSVRLQFEGWPAIQFVGWPSVAVGTFGGTVAFVDAAADEYGKTRVLVVPEDAGVWPEPRFLRQGQRAHGWVLLDRVSLGFEIWRQLNGFPPSIPSPPQELAKNEDGRPRAYPPALPASSSPGGAR